MSNGAWSGGKGSKPRKVDPKKFGDNYDRIFGKGKCQAPKSRQDIEKKGKKDD